MYTQNLSLLRIDGQRHMHIYPYCFPWQVANLYHPQLIQLLVKLPTNTEDPVLYVPSTLWCARGNPVHLNLSAPANLAVRGWKQVCMEIIGGWERRYTSRALLNTVDKFFAGYPYAQ